MSEYSLAYLSPKIRNHRPVCVCESAQRQEVETALVLLRPADGHRCSFVRSELWPPHELWPPTSCGPELTSHELVFNIYSLLVVMETHRSLLVFSV